MAHVLLLRASNTPDAYEYAFKSRGYNPLSVPVLETTSTSLDRLKDTITAGLSRCAYAGVVITSGRSCEAWKTVAGQLAQSHGDIEGGNSATWADIPFYVVGEATARALADIGASIGAHPFVPRDIRGAAESGTGEKLAHFILRDLAPSPEGKRLLYLTGDKNRDTLPNILASGGVALDPLQVYATRGSSTFHIDLERAVHAHPASIWWIVFFSPSDADFASPALREHFVLPSTDSSELSPRIAAIGPTSARHLDDKLAMRVDAVSSKPNAEALAASIAGFDASISTRVP
ncbi:uncharacterized protein FIBRA_01827 [Fibroporia radiculosa]|uniref:Tetrapyrrole biosynthesis uroporphyrinogen III synthase domain-containing protein n=1 Tax=Fibroporia radiculosa TaxID=599839 RepID=J4G173_9APHY|nr:uncharacterized protein FIBRA_01827 [Fibroporia radiculosa]CCL99803.1 predicted protein [Fibroporia radiculosa]